MKTHPVVKINGHSQTFPPSLDILEVRAQVSKAPKKTRLRTLKTGAILFYRIESGLIWKIKAFVS